MEDEEEAEKKKREEKTGQLLRNYDQSTGTVDL